MKNVYSYKYYKQAGEKYKDILSLNILNTVRTERFSEAYVNNNAAKDYILRFTHSISYIDSY